MAISRKNFVSLAANIARINDERARALAAKAVADACSEHNDQFSYSRFYDACNVSYTQVEAARFDAELAA